MKFFELYNLYIDDSKKRFKESTIAGFYYIYKKYLYVFADYKVSSITIEHLRQYQTELLETTSAYRINKVFSFLGRVLDFGCKYYGLSENVSNKLYRVKDFAVKEPIKYFTYEEYKKFISVVPNSLEDKDYIFYLMFQTLYYTGLRTGELLALNMGDIDLKRKVILINKNYVRGSKNNYSITSTKTCSSSNFVSIPKTLYNDYTNYFKYLGKSYMKIKVLFTYKGNRVNKRTLERRKNYYCDLAGVKQITLHGFRHSFASLIYELSNYNFTEVAKRLRHKNTSTVMKTYVNVFPSKSNAVDIALDKL